MGVKVQDHEAVLQGGNIKFGTQNNEEGIILLN